MPSPNVAEDHQTKNAMALVNKQAAILVKDADASTELIKKAIELAKDQNKQTELSNKIKTLAIYNSTEIIANEVLKLLKISK